MKLYGFLNVNVKSVLIRRTPTDHVQLLYFVNLLLSVCMDILT